MAKFSVPDLAKTEAVELLAGLSARRKALDKLFKGAVKEGLQAVMDQINVAIRAVNAVEEKIKNALSDAE